MAEKQQFLTVKNITRQLNFSYHCDIRSAVPN